MVAEPYLQVVSLLLFPGRHCPQTAPVTYAAVDPWSPPKPLQSPEDGIKKYFQFSLEKRKYCRRPPEGVRRLSECNEMSCEALGALGKWGALCGSDPRQEKGQRMTASRFSSSTHWRLVSEEQWWERSTVCHFLQLVGFSQANFQPDLSGLFLFYYGKALDPTMWNHGSLVS